MRILLSAYACEPGKGSEPGAGWHAATAAAARGHDVTVITRANNRPRIEAAGATGITFSYVDLPGWARRWKRGGRGVRTYYLLWQVGCLLRARRLHRERRFDVVHHVTFANVWQPALTAFVPAPFVLGPVGGGPLVPLRAYRWLGLHGALAELMLRAARRLSRANPLVGLGLRRAQVILSQNEETVACLPRSLRARAIVRPNATADPALAREHAREGARRAVFAGRLVPWKGAMLALEALALLPEWRLDLLGDGPDRRRIKRRARRLGVEGRVELAGRLAQSELADRLAAADVLVLPSLREDASFAAVEAQLAGLPVVAFDRGGPRALAREPHARFHLVPLTGRRDAAALAAALEAALEAARTHRDDGVPDYSPARFGQDLEAAYRRAIASAPHHGLQEAPA